MLPRARCTHAPAPRSITKTSLGLAPPVDTPQPGCHGTRAPDGSEPRSCIALVPVMPTRYSSTRSPHAASVTKGVRVVDDDGECDGVCDEDAEVLAECDALGVALGVGSGVKLDEGVECGVCDGVGFAEGSDAVAVSEADAVQEREADAVAVEDDDAVSVRELDAVAVSEADAVPERKADAVAVADDCMRMRMRWLAVSAM